MGLFKEFMAKSKNIRPTHTKNVSSTKFNNNSNNLGTSMDNTRDIGKVRRS